MSQSKKPKSKASRPNPRPSADIRSQPLPFTGLQAVKYLLAAVYAAAAIGYTSLCWKQYVVIDGGSKVFFVFFTFLQLMLLLYIFSLFYRLAKFLARFARH